MHTHAHTYSYMYRHTPKHRHAHAQLAHPKACQAWLWTPFPPFLYQVPLPMMKICCPWRGLQFKLSVTQAMKGVLSKGSPDGVGVWKPMEGSLKESQIDVYM